MGGVAWSRKKKTDNARAEASISATTVRGNGVYSFVGLTGKNDSFDEFNSTREAQGKHVNGVRNKRRKVNKRR